jgi:diguanylate cyclase (GGDEF)-like protein
MLKELNTSDLDALLKACPMGLAMSDSNKNITWVNKTFEDYLGIAAEEIQGTNIDTLPPGLKQLFTSSSTIHIPANAIRDAQWYMCSKNNLGETGNTMHYISDVGPLYLVMQEKEILRAELEEALARDPVTGMPNKKALIQSLESQVSRSRRYNNLLSIVIMKVENLEDLHSQMTADLLVPVSQLLNDQVRWADIVGKLNESEFLLVLPETSAESCKSLCDNLAQRLSELSLPESIAKTFKVATRFGYAQWEKGDDVKLLMLKARKMLEEN